MPPEPGETLTITIPSQPFVVGNFLTRTRHPHRSATSGWMILCFSMRRQSIYHSTYPEPPQIKVTQPHHSHFPIHPKQVRSM